MNTSPLLCGTNSSAEFRLPSVSSLAASSSPSAPMTRRIRVGQRAVRAFGGGEGDAIALAGARTEAIPIGIAFVFDIAIDGAAGVMRARVLASLPASSGGISSSA
jgi:hypothetical protein